MQLADDQIALVRAFNRDYTRRIGVLQQSLHDSPYSLTEARVLYEIAHEPAVTAGELAARLDLDRGYLSRILARFTKQKLITQAASAEDGRRRHLALTATGRRSFASLDSQSQQQAARMLSGLDAPRLQSVLSGMQSIRAGFDPAPVSSEVVLRQHRPGDMGWVVERHGALYFEEYGWDERFEALVAQITADFITNLDAARERCWIAERSGVRLGCIFVVRQSETIAKLRLLLVEPKARGLGVGRRLVTECVQFARTAGYRKVALWTQQNLSAARHLYEEAGFKRISQTPHQSFGHDLIAETWELEL